jgi:lysophospholipase L1-like esterase
MLALLAACTPPVRPSGQAADSTGDTFGSIGVDETGRESGGRESAGESAPPESAPAGETGDTAMATPLSCLESLATKQATPPDYAQFDPVLNGACMGTNHQHIADIQHVVFVGDSVTVGTPPNTVENFWRNVVAVDLAARFGIEAPEEAWYWYDLWTGNAYEQDSGAFSVCAKYGARTDDLVEDNDQIIECIPEDRAGENTLVMMTVGGNDLFALVEDYAAGVDVATLWSDVEREVTNLRDAVTWVKTDRDRFPGEMSVVVANVFEFTDGMGNVDACPGAETLGYSYDLSAPDLQDMIRYYQEQWMSIAVETQSDIVFMGEAFCGHGYNADDPSGPCYRADTQELWFDLTCFHPNDAGHLATAELMLSVVEE